MKKVIKGLLLVFICLMFINNVSAKTLGQMKKELSNMREEYKKNQSQKSLTQGEMNEVKAKISSINNEINASQREVSKLNDDIDKRNKEIEKMNDEIKAIMHYYQVSSSESFYLDYVFNASNFTDFIYRLAISEQLSEYRENTIAQYNKLIEENKQKVSELAKKEVSLKNLQGDLSKEYNKLGDNLADYAEAIIDIKDEIDDLEKLINLYQTKYKCSENEDVGVCVNRYNKAQIKKRQSSSGGSSSSTTAYGSLPSAAGFYRPVASGRINQNFGDSNSVVSFPHRGIDIGVGHGTTVYSIANGTVVRIAYRSSCGGNMVYIGHNVNGRTYTSGYYHLASINVSVGQSVTYNTVIGRSGGVPSIETWDGCSSGAHLHLQLAPGIYMTDYFTGYEYKSINPRTILNFPGVGGSFSGR